MDTASSTPSVSDAPIPLMKPVTAVVADVPPAPAPVPPPVVVPPAPPASTARKGSWGGLISIMLIVFVIILAAFYSWGERLATQSPSTTESETVE